MESLKQIRQDMADKLDKQRSSSNERPMPKLALPKNASFAPKTPRPKFGNLSDEECAASTRFMITKLFDTLRDQELSLNARLRVTAWEHLQENAGRIGLINYKVAQIREHHQKQ